MEIFDYFSKNDALEFTEEYTDLESCIYTQTPKPTKYLMVKTNNKNKKSQLRIKLSIVDHDPNEGIPFKKQI
jgi:hypothetical protein